MNDKNLTVFNFENKTIRTEVIDNEPYFCASDVCKILEYKNGRDTVEKNCKKDGVATNYIIDSLGREQQATFINEPNLYRLIIKSKMPKALEFQDWIFEEVIPQIRKTGKYEIKKQLPQTYKEALLELVAKVERIETLEIENRTKDEQINKYIAIDDNKTYTDIAKILKIKPKHFIDALRMGKYIRQNRIPYQRYIDSKLFTIKKSITEKNNKVKHYESYLITPKGFEYFYKKVERITQ